MECCDDSGDAQAAVVEDESPAFSEAGGLLREFGGDIHDKGIWFIKSGDELDL